MLQTAAEHEHFPGFRIIRPVRTRQASAVPPTSIISDHAAAGVAGVALRIGWARRGHDADRLWFEKQRNAGRSANVTEELHKLG